MDTDSRIGWSPHRVALGYALVGAVWILLTESLSLALFEGSTTVATVQLAKGWLFVGGSAAVVYGLVWYGHRDLERTNERLDAALQQSSILHRVLRHNLRNTCNIIDGNSQLLADHVDGGPAEPDPAECVTAIREQTDRLITISEKTRLLREIVLESEDADRPVDLAALVRSRAASARERYPRASIETSVPERLRVETTPRVGTAVDELLENAIEHNDAPEPSVEVSVRPGTRRVTIVIRDDGPGMPAVEREVLETGLETPMYHSEGLGLWIAHSIVLQAGGRFRITEGDPSGTVVKLSVPI